MYFRNTLLVLTLMPVAVLAAEQDPDKVWSAEATLNYVNRSGNTESTNLDLRSKAVRDGETWRNTYKLEASNETSEVETDTGNVEEVRTAEKYFGSAKADYKVGEKSYLFGLLEYTDDRFSGYDYEAAVTFGYGRDILETEAHTLSADAGLGYRESKVTETGDVEEEAIIRLGAVYQWKISETTTFDEEFSTEIGEERTVTKSFSRLKFQINGRLNASVAYEIEHTDDVPPGVKNSDRKFLVGLNYSY
ncbi:MAG: DUF481 domain-containing protein [Pseudomonadota bacterium]|mgnify:CR=1 FL=1|nr:hypothetical protein [Pseudomonadales bacterium]MDY6920743.1 DUF481 domain-containing protein [Pseudomonadota bacterium]